MNTQTTVGQLVVERPSRARVFEQFGIDYCCGGKKPLQQACQDKGIDIMQVIGAFDLADNAPSTPARDWTQATLSELADHIEKTHHAYLKSELPRLDYLIGRVVKAHGDRHPELMQLRDIFAPFKLELEQHMQKEEGVLFPLCRKLESAATRPEFHCGPVANPIAVMIREHNDAGHDLAQMRELTGGYSPPEGACNTYRAMLSGLAELETDMHLHVHLENNILFPLAQETEKKFL